MNFSSQSYKFLACIPLFGEEFVTYHLFYLFVLHLILLNFTCATLFLSWKAMDSLSLISFSLTFMIV